jgi:hypothetical protein
MERIWVLIKNNYVIYRYVWDGVTPHTPPYEYDLILEDINQNVSVGDWYETSEGIFYRPLSTPPDLVTI